MIDDDDADFMKANYTIKLSLVHGCWLLVVVVVVVVVVVDDDDDVVAVRFVLVVDVLVFC